MKSRSSGCVALLGLGLLLVPPARALDLKVSGYTTFFAECGAPECGKRLIVLRKFRQGGETRLFAVDPRTLETEVRSARGLSLKRMSWPALRSAIAADAYGRALADSTRGALRQNAGIVHALPPGRGVVLTVDLCPSARPLDRRLFRTIIDTFLPEEKPVPLGIALTGRWMDEHPADFAWLRRLATSGDVGATWINHSFSHPYAKGVALSRNFLLQPGTDLRREILATEEAMLNRGLRPSIFFRFPGLVSDPGLVARVASYGLVVVGSDAWLAKKQEPSSGSIVLVHGNGNEPYGVERFLRLVRRERLAIRSRNWLLFDLRDSIRHEETR